MQQQKLPAVNGNRSLVCFVISLVLTTALIIVIITGYRAIVENGVSIFLLAVIAAATGLGFALRAWKLSEEPFRYQFAIVFNSVMIFLLLMMMAMFFFMRAYGQGMV